MNIENSNNILLSKRKCIRIFNKYNFKYDKNIFNTNINILFTELCKIPNIHYKFIKNCINKNLDINKSFIYILNKFQNSTSENILNNINIIKLFIKYIDKNNINIIRNDINNKLQLYDNDKKIYSSLKLLSIYISKNYINNSYRIYNLLNIIKSTKDNEIIIYNLNKLSNKYLNKYEDINYNYIVNSINNIIYNKDINILNNIKLLLDLINKCKNFGNIIKNDLESILLKCDKNIGNYIYFLNNNDNLLIEKDNVLIFLKNFGYDIKSFKDIDSLKLKRGFIQGLVNNNKEYLLKYQPNKSLMELILNTYLKSLNYSNFLIPQYFFINNDNSYFYIIEKYNTDLYKYYNLLESNNKILSFKSIINITIFIINSIETLHKNNIIHSDLKPENIVININNEHEIIDLKIIDFDVGLFNIIPDKLNPIPEKYTKILNNKKPRGTRIYMLKDKNVTFNNDIFGFGVILLILLFKNIKILLSIEKKKLINDTQNNKKKIIKLQVFIKRLNILRDSIEKNDSKIKILNIIDTYMNKSENNTLNFFSDNDDILKFKEYKNLIIDCINMKLNINEIKDKYYNNLLESK